MKLPNGADFTLSSMRLAGEVADQVGLSTAATEVLQTAITMHYTPGVTTAANRGVPARGGCGRGRGRRPELGPAAADAAQRGAGLPASRVQEGVRGRVPRRSGPGPQGRAKFVNRYGALITAIKLAPFNE